MTKSMLILSVSAVLTLCGTGNLNLALASPSNHNTYTPTLHTELKPTPIQPYQIARATFLPDRFEDLGLSDYDSLDTDYNQENCDDYPLSICPEGAECDQCPFDVSKYRVYNCASPYIKSGDSCACPPSVSTDNPNDVCTEYCGSNCIAKMCTPTPSHSNCSLGEEDCDNGCGENTRKCCVPCEHKITSKPANSSYTYEKCIDGDGEHQIQVGCVCNSGYHEKNGTCSNGGTCEKDCIVNSCSGYTLTSCPSDKICEECTKTAQNCSTDGTMYKAIGCKIDGQIDLDTYWCNGALRCWLKLQPA